MQTRRRTALGILATCNAFLCFTLMDAVFKWVGQRLPVIEQFVILTIAAAIAVFAFGSHGFCRLDLMRTRNLRLLAVRAVIYILSFSVAIYALRHLTLANFYALIFTGPLFVTLLSALVLKEETGWQRWTATIVGFCGVLIDLRPTTHLDLASIAVLFTALLYAIDVMIMRVANRTDSAAATAFYMQVLSLFPGLALMAHDYVAPSLDTVLWLILAGVLAASAQVSLSTGFRLATTPVGAPFHYTQLIWGLALGWFIWRDVPDFWTWTGAAIIAGSGLYILHRETMSAHSRPVLEADPTTQIS